MLYVFLCYIWCLSNTFLISATTWLHLTRRHWGRYLISGVSSYCRFPRVPCGLVTVFSWHTVMHLHDGRGCNSYSYAAQVTSPLWQFWGLVGILGPCRHTDTAWGGYRLDSLSIALQRTVFCMSNMSFVVLVVIWTQFWSFNKRARNSVWSLNLVSLCIKCGLLQFRTDLYVHDRWCSLCHTQSGDKRWPFKIFLLKITICHTNIRFG